MVGFGAVVKSPWLFHLGQTAGHLLWPVARKIPGADTLGRIPMPVSKTFRERVS
jgi:hypothetical protein